MRILCSLLGTAVLATGFCMPAHAESVQWTIVGGVQSVDNSLGLLPIVVSAALPWEPGDRFSVTWEIASDGAVPGPGAGGPSGWTQFDDVARWMRLEARNEEFVLDAPGLDFFPSTAMIGNNVPGASGIQDQWTFGAQHNGDDGLVYSMGVNFTGPAGWFAANNAWFVPADPILWTFQREFYFSVCSSLGCDGFTATLNQSTVNTVPVPAAAWLMLSGLTGLGAFARRRRRV